MYFWDKHKTITSYYELLSGEVCDRYELTQMEYDILMFLHNNPQHNTAADIVKIRKSTKSHVSTSLKNLENKGLVERIQSKDNKKHIEIVLLDKAEVIVKAGINAQKQFAKDVLSGLTEEEKHMCIDVFDKICNNAEKYLKEYEKIVKEMMCGLENLKPTGNVDKDFLQSMIVHHQGAIDMVNSIIKYTDNAEIKKMAEGELQNQQPEIDNMKKLFDSIK